VLGAGGRLEGFRRPQAEIDRETDRTLEQLISLGKRES
jgi:hypothetical protein